ncbi:MAG: (Fe-S)-binding protein, partial [Eubacteriales bacterium]
ELPIGPNAALALDEDMGAALDMMEQINQIQSRLPGHDCGACGSPSCAAFAEDVARGYCGELDCVYMLKKHLEDMGKQ